jgi:hypothetical protein
MALHNSGCDAFVEISNARNAGTRASWRQYESSKRLAAEPAAPCFGSVDARSRPDPNAEPTFSESMAYNIRAASRAPNTYL